MTQKIKGRLSLLLAAALAAQGPAEAAALVIGEGDGGVTLASRLVERAHRAVLFREADAELVEQTAEWLASGGSSRWRSYLASLARSPEFRREVRGSRSNEEILAQIYEELLGPGRPVDPEGRRAYLPLIERGRVAQVVQAVGTSAEFLSVIERAEPPAAPTRRIELDPPPAPERGDGSHLKYFGYYRDDGLLDEIADHANLTVGGPGSDESGAPSVALLRQARAKGMKVMLDVQGIGIGFRDEESWRAKWENYSENIRPYVSPETVAAFYLYDEPPLEMTPELKAKLELGARVVRETFPGIPIALGFGWWSLAPHLQAEWPLTPPEGYDWFAFNCYGPYENCISGGVSVPGLFELLKSKLKPHQRILLIAEGTDWWAVSHNQPFEEAPLIPRADQYLQLALSEPVVIGYIPFLYSHPGFGAVIRDLPRLREKFREIGLSITRR